MEQETSGNEGVWLDSPAEYWKEGFPLGNGHMGAMLYGGVNRELVNLSEATCFSGEASVSNNQSGAKEAFHQMRMAVAEGDYENAKKLSDGFIGIRHNYGTNLPIGNLVIELPNQQQEGIVAGYRRELSLATATAQIEFAAGEAMHSRTAFLSNPDQVLVYRFKCNKPGNLVAMLSFESLPGREEGFEAQVDENLDLLLFGNAWETMHSDGHSGVRYHGRLRAVCRNGSISKKGNKLWIEQGDELLLLLSIATSFSIGGINTEVSGQDEVQCCLRRIEEAAKKGFDELLNRHVRDYQSLYERVQLKLNEGDSHLGSLPIDERLKRIQNGGEDAALCALMFQYGRYLLINSSRENSELPAHLQGAWNDNVACRIGWTCDMHLDINTQMNYWPAWATSLPECEKPLFHWIQNVLVPSGRLTAQESYGMKGWAAELVSNAWGFSAPYWHSNISPCPTGGLWIATHLWEHYQFTGDREFLEQEAYPVLQEAADFFLDYIFEDKKTGYLIGGPSISPENRFLVGEQAHSFSNGTTYEILMIRELFYIVAEARKVLGFEKDDSLEQAYSRLLPYEVDEKGRLKEWMHDYESEDLQHRHTSHLLGLFPFGQITPDKTPELAQAARKSIEGRLLPETGWEDTGWARSMLMLYEARLWNGEKAYEHIMSMQRNLTHPNLMVKHPPTRGAGSFDDVYELDGNTGLTTCITELLLQSHTGELHLLPALPRAWQSGSVQGLCARGGVIVDMEWQDGCLVKATFEARKAGSFGIRYHDSYREILLQAGEKTEVQFQ